MDVGAPSNFVRIKELFDGSHAQVSKAIKGYAYDDPSTMQALKAIKEETGYTADPHGAVGFLAAKEYLSAAPSNTHVTVLETAHPAKFLATVEEGVGEKIDIPQRLSVLSSRQKVATVLSNEYTVFKEYLLGKCSSLIFLIKFCHLPLRVFIYEVLRQLRIFTSTIVLFY